MRLVAIILDRADMNLDLICFVLKLKEVTIKKKQFLAILAKVFHVTCSKLKRFLNVQSSN